MVTILQHRQTSRYYVVQLKLMQCCTSGTQQCNNNKRMYTPPRGQHCVGPGTETWARSQETPSPRQKQLAPLSWQRDSSLQKNRACCWRRRGKWVWKEVPNLSFCSPTNSCDFDGDTLSDSVPHLCDVTALPAFRSLATIT